MNAPNIANRTIFTGDNLPIMRGINSESVDLIYLDPPFNSNRNYAAPIGSPAEGAGFKDIWTLDDIKEVQVEELKSVNYGLHAAITTARYTSGPAMTAYMTVMGIRLLEIHRLLKPTGSVYLHCDPTASHYIKGMMDAVFGARNMITEVIWGYGTPSGGRASGKRPVKGHDTILAYARNYSRHTFNRIHLPYNSDYVTRWFRHTDDTGRQYRTRKRGDQIVRQYLDESPGAPLSNTWTDIRQLYGSAGWFPTNRQEITGYPTQKPLSLLERIISISSNEGDFVLDPFCGCATACIAAERLERQWAGIDIAAARTGADQNAAGARGARRFRRSSDPYRLGGYAPHRYSRAHRRRRGHTTAAAGRAACPAAAQPGYSPHLVRQAGGVLQRLRCAFPAAEPDAGPYCRPLSGRGGYGQQFTAAVPGVQFQEKYAYPGGIPGRADQRGHSPVGRRRPGTLPPAR